MLALFGTLIWVAGAHAQPRGKTHLQPEAKIRAAAEAARSEIEAVASEAARDMVGRLTGLKVEQRDAAAAVKAEFHG